MLTPSMINGSNTDNLRLRIMIVEDEPDIGVIVTQMLSAQYEVVHAANGLEALERLNWYQPDLTIMDLMMPVLDGFDTTRAIKKDNDYASMPVMFLTARKDNRAVREALMAGGDVYLEKPFDPPELIARLQEMITRNGLKPKLKRHTLQEIQKHFSGGGTGTEEPPAPAPIGPRPLTEQLALSAAEPKPRVLLVHNVERVLLAAKQQFRNRYEILVCSDPEIAFDKIMAYQPDIVMIEVRMPSFNGLHFAQLLRLNRQLRVPHMIFLCDKEDPEMRAEAERLGGVLQISENVKIDRLGIELDRICRQPGFHRQRKRVDYREILHREEPSDDIL